MMTDRIDEHWAQMSSELQNFEEIARFLRPSPGEIPRLDGIDIAGLSMPMGQSVGGDHILYIDFGARYDLESRITEAVRDGRKEVAERLRRLRQLGGILVADVSGHRMTDALIAAMLHQAFLLGALYELDMFGEITTRLFEHINTRFYRSTAFNKYFTMVYGEISSEGRFRFLSAGHPRPAVFSREFGRFMKISDDRFVTFQPVGMLPSVSDPDDRIYSNPYGYKKRYHINEINLLAFGDTLLLHTDGLTEHAEGTYFPKRLEALLAELRDESADAVCTRMREDLLTHGDPCDDISVVVIRRTR